MRFDKLIELIALEDISDGLGGHTEVEKLICTKYANFEEMSLETTVKVYGDTYHQNAKVVALGQVPKVDIISVDSIRYKVVSQRKVKNKTSFFLELINND